MDRPLDSHRYHGDFDRHRRDDRERHDDRNARRGGYPYSHHHEPRHRAHYHGNSQKDTCWCGPPARGRSRSRDRYDDRRHHNQHQDRRPPLRDSNTNGQPKIQSKDIRAVPQPKDTKLPEGVMKDPRGEDPSQRLTEKASHRGNGRNTESFDPASTLVRPDMRVLIGSASKDTYMRKLKHDDVVIVPELFGDEDNWDTYYQLVQEMSDIQSKDVKGSEFVSWHEGAHLIVKKPEESPTFQRIIDKLCKYFKIKRESAGYRFNWYRDSSDWKPFHHDSAAFNPHRAKSQNITVGASFGATRELAFIRASEVPEAKLRLYFPQTNNGVFTFGRDVNILWKHGVNALHPDEQDGKGRISIILWGLAQNAIEEEGSPPLLGSDGQGPHAGGGRNHRHRGGGRRR